MYKVYASDGNIIKCEDPTLPNCTMMPSKIVADNYNWGKPMVFVQDLIGGVTFFIGVFVSVTLLISGFLYITAGADEKQAEKGKTGIKYSLIGLVIVILSYIIIRLVQIIAKG